MPTRKQYPVSFILRNFEIREDGKVYWRIDSQLRANNGGLWKSPAGSMNTQGYLRVRIKNGNYLVHHIAWILHHGSPLEPGFVLQHKDGDRTNNRIENLLPTSRKELTRRHTKLHPKNTSGHTGVYRHTPTDHWCAYITVDSKLEFLGYYPDKSEAISARLKAEAQYGFAHRE